MRVSHRSYSVYVKYPAFYAFPCLLVCIFVEQKGEMLHAVSIGQLLYGKEER